MSAISTGEQKESGFSDREEEHSAKNKMVIIINMLDSN